MEPLRLQFTVACPAERAFALWAEETTRWWPHGHSVSGAPGLTVTFEPRAGGRIFERTPDGAEHDWGGARLGAAAPPRLPLAPAVRPQRRDRGRGDVHEEGTAVAIEHRGWERLGAIAEERRERNRRGWAGVVDRYVAAASDE
jgi:hypothetical protein